FDGHVRHFPAAVPHEALRLPQDSAGTARHRVADEAPSVDVCSRIGREDVASLDTPAVGADARHRDAQLRKQRGGFVLGRHRGDLGNPVSSSPSPPSMGSTTLFTGASGGTPRSRSAAPITFANPGAATLPP